MSCSKLISDLQTVLDNRRWVRNEYPFPHVTAQNVFKEATYHAIQAEFDRILSSGLSEVPCAGRFSRSIAGYDAYGIGFERLAECSLSFFSSRSWHDLMARLFGVTATGHVNIGAHHHRIGSSNGWIHNDFNPAWFPADSLQYKYIRHPDHQLCKYKTGAGPLSEKEKIELVRAVAMIFYLSNDGWTPGDGGETGLFDSFKTVPDRDCVKISPLNNSILLFECTPYSYHTFLHNPGRARNSIMMWIHRSKEDALLRWRAEDLELWR